MENIDFSRSKKAKNNGLMIPTMVAISYMPEKSVFLSLQGLFYNQRDLQKNIRKLQTFLIKTERQGLSHTLL